MSNSVELCNEINNLKGTSLEKLRKYQQFFENENNINIKTCVKFDNNALKKAKKLPVNEKLKDFYSCVDNEIKEFHKKFLEDMKQTYKNFWFFKEGKATNKIEPDYVNLYKYKANLSELEKSIREVLRFRYIFFLLCIYVILGIISGFILMEYIPYSSEILLNLLPGAIILMVCLLLYGIAPLISIGDQLKILTKDRMLFTILFSYSTPFILFQVYDFFTINQNYNKTIDFFLVAFLLFLLMYLSYYVIGIWEKQKEFRNEEGKEQILNFIFTIAPWLLVSFILRQTVLSNPAASTNFIVDNVNVHTLILIIVSCILGAIFLTVFFLFRNYQTVTEKEFKILSGLINKHPEKPRLPDNPPNYFEIPRNNIFRKSDIKNALKNLGYKCDKKKCKYPTWNDGQYIIAKIKSSPNKKKWIVELDKLEIIEESIKNKINTYLNNIYSNMDKYKPLYSPLGFYIGDIEDRNWVSKDERENLQVRSYATSGLTSQKLLLIECKYLKNKWILGQVDNDLKKAKRKKMFFAICYVSYSTEIITDYFMNYKYPNHSIYLYDIKNDKLYFNETDEKTKLFSEWFKKEGKPLNKIEFMKINANKHGNISKQYVIERFKLKNKEIDRMFKELIKKKKIVFVTEDEYRIIQ